MVVRMKYPMLFMVTLALTVVQNGVTDALFTTYFETANSFITVEYPGFGSDSSGILKSHLLFYPIGLKKTVTFETTSRDYGISLSIRMLDFRPNRMDNLTFLEVNNPATSVMYNNLFRNRNKFYDALESKTFVAPSGRLAITFQTSSKRSAFSDYEGFELIYTAYSTKFVCGRSEFKCSNRRCISDFLTCDDHNHCGDRSDQWSCSRGKVNVVGMSLGIVFLLIAVACVIFIFMRRRASRSRTEVQTVISHPPPTNYPPQPGTCYPPPPPAYSQYSPGQTNPVYH